MKRVTVSMDNGIATVSLNRPEKCNALDFLMFTEIDRVAKKLKKDTSVKAVILRGEGKDFSSGLDIKSVMKSKSAAIKLLFKWRPGAANLAQRVSTHWRSLPVPVIACIEGRCWGGGLQIVLGADFRIAHPNASLSIMESKWGLIPDMGGSLALREIMACDQAMKLAMTAEEISGTQAKELGLITNLSESPFEAAVEFANHLAERSSTTNAAIKKLFHKAWHYNDAYLLARESWYQVKVIARRSK